MFPSHVEGSHSLVRIKPTDKQEKEEGLLVTLFPFLKPSSGCLNSRHGHHEPEESSSMKSDLSCWIEKGHRISQTFLLSTQLPCTYFMILIIVVTSLSSLSGFDEGWVLLLDMDVTVSVTHQFP